MEQRQKSLDLLQGLAKLTENMTQEEWDIYVKGLNLKEENVMGDECKWVDGKFYPCEGFTGEVFHYCGGKFECSVCKADIRKLESEVVVKKSGGTWVARYNDVDYLDISGNTTQDDIATMDFTNLEDISWWMPIKGLEITDEIAKLRPMVVCDKCAYPEKLFGVPEGTCILTEYGLCRATKYRFATVEDL